MSNSKASGNNHLNHDPAPLRPVTSFVKGATLYGKSANTNKPKKTDKKK